MPNKDNMVEQTKDETDLGKVVKLLVIIGFLLGVNYTIWFSNIVPDDISPKVIAQALLSSLSIFCVIAVILVVRRKWI